MAHLRRHTACSRQPLAGSDADGPTKPVPWHLGCRGRFQPAWLNYSASNTFKAAYASFAAYSICVGVSWATAQFEVVVFLDL